MVLDRLTRQRVAATDDVLVSAAVPSDRSAAQAVVVLAVAVRATVVQETAVQAAVAIHASLLPLPAMVLLAHVLPGTEHNAANSASICTEEFDGSDSRTRSSTQQAQTIRSSTTERMTSIIATA